MKISVKLIFEIDTDLKYSEMAELLEEHILNVDPGIGETNSCISSITIEETLEISHERD